MTDEPAITGGHAPSRSKKTCRITGTMSTQPSWQSAFVATTFAIGGSIEDARAALRPDDLTIAQAVLEGLTQPSRAGRARALAGALGRIVTDVELARLA